MAESYRGLTIRIGGDTTKLQKALKASESAAAGAQQEIRKLGDALKMDPSNVEAYNMQLGYMGDKATATAMRLQQLRVASEQIGSMGVNLTASKTMSEPVEKLAAATEDAHMRATQAKAAYNKVTDSLADMYTTLTKYNQAAADTFNINASKLMGSLKIDSADFNLREIGDQLQSMFGEFSEVIEPLKRPISEVIAEMEELRAKFLETESVAKKAKFEKQFEKLREEITNVNGLKISFDFENGTTNWEQLDKVFNTLEDVSGLDPSQIARFRAEISRLKSEYVGAMDELQKANAVAQWSDLQAEILKAQASVKDIAKALADMRVPSDLMRSMTELTEKSDELKSSFSKSMGTGRSSESAYSINPGNVQAQDAAMLAFAEAERLAAERAEVLREQISQFDRSKIDEYTDATKSSELQLIEASVAHSEAAERLNNYRGAIQATIYNLNQLGLDANEVAKILEGTEGFKFEDALSAEDTKRQEFLDWVNRLIDALSNYRQETEATGDSDLINDVDAQVKQLEALEDATRNLQKAQEDERATKETLEYSKQRSELSGLDSSLVQTTGDIDTARVAMQKLAAGDVKPHVDTTELDKLKDARAELERYGSSVGKSFDGVSNDLKVLGGIIDSSTDKAKSLMNVFTEDPSNTDAITSAVSATDEALAACNIRADELREIINSYTPDKVNQVAINTNTIGINAERAAHQVEEAFRNVDEARKKADELAKQYSDALNSAEGSEGGADNSIVRNIKEQLDEAQAEFERLQKVANDALSNLDIANATKELQSYKNELVQVEQTYRDVARIRDQAVQAEAIAVDFGDTSKIDEMGTELDAAAKRAKALDEALKLDPKNIELARQKTDAFNDVAALAKKRAEAIKQAIDSYDTSKVKKLRDEYGSVGEALRVTSDAFRRIDVAASKTEAELDKLLKDAGLESMRDDIIANAEAFDSRLTPEIREAVTALNALRSASSDVKGELSSAASASQYERLVDSAANTAATANLDGMKVDEAAFQQALGRMAEYAERAGRQIVESANTIDSAYRDMRKTVEATEPEFVRIRDAAIEFSQTHITSADQILEMEALGGQLGIASSALQSFGENASNLLIATDFESADELALKLGQLTNVMSDLDDTTFDNFADALVRLGNNTATTESQIMNVAQRMSSVANVTSMTTPQLLAWSAAIASTGQRSESAATAITRTITGIGQAVSEGGDTLEQFASIANMTADEFESAWASSSSEALEAFVKGLEGLSDTSTEAIEALDSVGISSVRQETALLGLSQTIDNLDASIEMSYDAFNGIGDQWGAAGDAAREANEKSKGFSGSLGILQNTASNLAASLGDSLVPAMDMIAAALRWLKDLLDAIPEPMRSTVVTIGGMSVAVGTLVPIVKQLSDGWKALTVTMSASKLQGFSGAIMGVATYLKTLITSFATATVSTRDFGFALEWAKAEASAAGTSFAALGTSLLTMGAIGAAVFVIGSLVTALSNAYNQAKKLEEAKRSLSESSSRLAAAANGAVSSQDSLSSSMSDLRVNADDAASAIERLVEKQNQLAQSMESSNSSFAAQSAMVGDAKSIIDQYANTSGLTYDQQTELASAVQMLNKELGTTYEVVDAANGKIREQGSDTDIATQALDAYIEKQLQMAESQSILNQLEDAYTAYYEAQNDYAKESAKLQEMEEANAGSMGSYVATTREAVDANIDVIRSTAESSSAIEAQKDIVNTAERVMNDFGSTVDILKGKYQDNAYAVESASMEEVAAISEVVSASELIGNALDRTGTSADDFAGQFARLGGTTRDFSALTEQQLLIIAKAYDGSVDSIKSSLDSLNIKFKKTLSGFKADEPVEPMKTTDPEYKAEKKRLDQAYKDQQKLYDKQYKERQKAYDKEYKAHQKALDKEYKAAQKASQKYLKDYKKAQDEQVDAFKKATEERLKLLEEEYETKKKLLEDEYSKYDTGIDERIDAINAEQEAEDRAKKQQEQAEKIADLQAAVRRAKTNKKRAEAQKDLNEYLESIEAEHRKEDRQAQVEALKQQKSDLKDELAEKQQILKDSYDTAKDTYKESREAELKVLQESLEAAYEMQQEAQQAQLEALKESQQSQLEAMKESQQAELEAMKEWQQSQLESMKEDNEQALEDFANHVSSTADRTSSLFDAISKGASVAAENTMTNYANGIMTGNERVDKAITGVSDFVVGAFDGVSKVMSGEGQNNVTEYANGVNRGSKDAYDAVGAVVRTMTKIYGSMSDGTGISGSNAMIELANGMARNSNRPVQIAGEVMSAVMKTLSNSMNAVTSGANLAINFANGITRNRNQVVNAAASLARDVAAYIHHSVPEKGPLHDDDKWGSEMVQNYIDSMMSMEGQLGRESESLAETIADGFSPEELSFSSDPVQSLIQDMRDKEGALAAQAERMSKIVENGFDPHVTIDAAYEAMDKINAGKIRREQMVAKATPIDQSTYAPVINITIPEMVIREEADVDRVSRAVATKVQRALSSKIG